MREIDRKENIEIKDYYKNTVNGDVDTWPPLTFLLLYLIFLILFLILFFY